MNTKAITNIQRQADVLSDSHQEIVDQAVLATAAIINIDDCIEKWKEHAATSGLSVHVSRAQRQLNVMEELLEAQATRALRVRSEIKQIKRNLKVE